jgi:single-strand DNA-binding protein
VLIEGVNHRSTEEALMNSTQQIGRLTADPESVRETEHGKVSSFRLAVPRSNGASKKADFFTVEVWNRLAETCAKYLREGREVAVTGRLEQREWRTDDDQPRERVVIVARSVDFLRGRKADDEAYGEPVAAGAPSDEDIPF